MKVVTDPKKQQRKIKHMHSGPDGSLESESTGGHSGMNKTETEVDEALLLERYDGRH